MRILVRVLVTVAWPYIYHVPHLGTMIQLLSADVTARYYRMCGSEVVFVSGSDEHGTPIEVEAVKLGVQPKELTDKNHEKVTKLFKKWRISFDNYTRTETQIHKDVVNKILLKIQKNGYMFVQETSIPYCEVCKRFLPDRFVKGMCPRCENEGARGDQCDECGMLLEPSKLIEPRCAICGKTPLMKKTTHWYFDLPRFTDKLQSYIVNNNQFPDNARNFSLTLLREGLKPRPITRDNKWGVNAPFRGAENKTIYVWIEAVLGYVSATIEYFHKLGREEGWRDYWFNKETKTLYFIGKDNIPFHTIILPALLLATESSYNLPWNVDSTEFLLLGGRKISRSERIAIWIDEALELYPVDYWRYVLIAIRPETRDTSFTWTTFIEKVNADLNDTLGNFVHRTITFLNSYFDSKVPTSSFDVKEEKVYNQARKTVEKIVLNLRKSKIQKALQNVIGLSRLGNRLLNEREPWKLLKTDPQKAAGTMHVAAQLVKMLAVSLEAFLPDTAEKIWKLLNLKGDVHVQTWIEATNPLSVGHCVSKAKPLFSKIDKTGETLQAELLKARSSLHSHGKNIE